MIFDCLNKSAIKINPAVIFKLPVKPQHGRKLYGCTACGYSWDNQDKHFFMSDSPLYQKNNGYINVCINCLEMYFDQLTEYYSGDEQMAIKHICMQYDVPYSDDIWETSEDLRANSRLKKYFSGVKRSDVDTSFIGSLTREFIDLRDNGMIINSVDEAKNSDTDITGATVARWGSGFAESDYRTLEEHYKFLKKHNPNADANQEIFIKDLCYTHLLKMQAIRDTGNVMEFEKLNRAYRDTFKQAGLRTVEEKDTSKDETLGVTLATISKYTPEEYYKNKKLYTDFDGIGDYFKRFVLRPMKNIAFGSKDEDKEYFVPEPGDGNGG